MSSIHDGMDETSETRYITVYYIEMTEGAFSVVLGFFFMYYILIHCVIHIIFINYLEDNPKKPHILM